MTVWRMAMRCGNRGSSMFEKCREMGIAAITYRPIHKIDLSRYSKDNLPRAWSQLARSQKSSMANLAFKINQGDIIYVKDGPQIVARGVVTGNYQFIGETLKDDDGDWWSHTVTVKWDTEAEFAPVKIKLNAEQFTVLELKGERLARLEAAIAAQFVPRVLFARVGWMKYYDGPREDDPKPISGGKYNKEQTGHEVYNYHDINGYCHSFFEPPGRLPASGKKDLNIKRIVPDAEADEVTGVTVVFVARHPSGGQFVVGWHRNATVYCACQRVERFGLDGYGYYTRTRTGDVVLLPVSERSWRIPSDHSFGNSNVCYTLNDDGSLKRLPWQQDILDKIRAYSGPNVYQNPVLEEDEEIRTRSSGQGYGLNTVQRKAVEDCAMNAAERYFRANGYDFNDTHKTKPYDYTCTINGEQWFVEVKGTTGQPDKILVTSGEVEHARSPGGRTILFIVHGIRLDKNTQRASGGRSLMLQPWHPEDKDLEITAYQYTLPKNCKGSI